MHLIYIRVYTRDDLDYKCSFEISRRSFPIFRIVKCTVYAKRDIDDNNKLTYSDFRISGSDVAGDITISCQLDPTERTQQVHGQHDG